ncbi:hypothetical protein SteCoe_9786 [Stentor coeruleus]|uniref:Cyclin N-terminal domain-containing protein n=1 Tax=Stentor coeruleus TaxID=5963 RepID=A0A1R2CH24_9CILI|nr:hypothetical protein SteCoe_9786 [Stentor coeruleus]
MSNQISKKPIRNTKPKIILPKKCEEESALLLLLKKYSLQAYYKNLAEKGFDSNLRLLVTMPDQELEAFLDSIKFFPGHRSKFLSILNLLKKLNFKDTPRQRSSSTRSHSKEKQKRPGSCKTKNSMDTGSLRKILDFHNSDYKNESATERLNFIPSPNSSYNTKNPSIDLAAELEKARKKILELTKKLENKSQSPKKSQVFDPFEPFPEINKQDDELGMSYDSSKMRSTLYHLDIEEICKCLSKALRKMIIEKDNANYSGFSESSSFNPPMIIPSDALEIFNKQFYDPYSRFGIIPGEDEIYNISKNILIRSQMEKECSIICLIYIERLRTMTGIYPTECNWKRLLFLCLVLASKIWDDKTYENQNFADVFSNITLRELNAMEVTFLNLVDYKVGVNKSEYAKFYFLLRTFTDKKCRSFPLVPLDVDTVRKLQSSANNAETKLREIHEENLYKTL